MSNYTIYHCHDYYSNPIAGVDSVVSPQQYAVKAAELGIRTFGFSNHGNIYNWIEEKDVIESSGMKYLHASEIYVTLNNSESSERLRDNYHLVAISKNWDGVMELNGLVSKAFNRDDGYHFYYMPRITFDELDQISDNIMITTACVASPLGIKSTDESRERMIKFLWQHHDNCYLEIQHHNCDKQKDYNRYICQLSKALDIPLIAGTDTHCLNEDTELARLLMQNAMGVSYPDEETFNLRLMSYSEICDEYSKQNATPESVWLEALENTNRMADRVESFELDKSFKYPYMSKNADELLWQKIRTGFENHPFASKKYSWSDVEDRCKEEYEVIKDTGAVDFILLQAHVRDWEKKNGVHTGFGRGSVGGSFVAYILGITDIDSIKNNLSFSRFMSRERVNLADIDTDYDEASREKTRKFMMEDHLDLPGIEASEIVTFGTMGVRKAIEYLGKAFDLSLSEVNDIKSKLGDKDEVTDELRRKYPELFRFVDIVQGVVINTSSHASGHVITDRKIAEELGLCSNKGDQYPICCQEMSILDKYNWVKFDLLGLRTLEHINLCSEYAGLPYLTPDTPIINDLQDPEVYKSLSKDTTMIFQYESNLATHFIQTFFAEKTIKKVKKRLGDYDYARMGSIATAALRPGSTSYREDVANGQFVDYDLNQFQKFLDPTFGRLIFQETITGFLVEFCGYTSGKADVIRRLVAKKHPEDLEKVLPEITDGFCNVMGEKYGFTREQAEAAIKPFEQTIIDASSYAFNEAHSTSYHGISYISCWERLYYPVEWACAGLNAYNGYEKQTVSITNWCKKNNIKISPVRFGHSVAGYTFDTKERVIYKGIGGIKGLSDKVGDEIQVLYSNHYDSFTDLLYDLKDKVPSLKRDQLEVLIKLGYFEMFGNANKLLYVCSRFDQLYKRKTINRDAAHELDLDPEIIRRFSGKETATRIDEIDVEKYILTNMINRDDIEKCRKRGSGTDWSTKKVANKLGLDLQSPDLLPYATKIIIGGWSDIRNRELIKYYEETATPAPVSITTQIAWEKEYLGYIEYSNPDLDKRLIYVMNLNTKYSPRFDAYCLKTGETVMMKVKKRKWKEKEVKVSYADLPFNNGDILYMRKCKQEFARKMNDDGEWGADTSRKDWWLYDYGIVEPEFILNHETKTAVI